MRRSRELGPLTRSIDSVDTGEIGAIFGRVIATGLHRDKKHVTVNAIGDEHLGAVQHPVITVTNGSATHARQIGPGVGFGHRDGGNLFARDQIRQVTSQLFWCASMIQMRAGHVGMHEHGYREPAITGAPQLLGQNDGRQGVQFTAAVLGRIANAKQPELAHFSQNRSRHHAVQLPLVCKRQNFGRDEAANGVAQLLVFGVEEGIDLHGLGRVVTV